MIFLVCFSDVWSMQTASSPCMYVYIRMCVYTLYICVYKRDNRISNCAPRDRDWMIYNTMKLRQMIKQKLYIVLIFFFFIVCVSRKLDFTHLVDLKAQCRFFFFFLVCLFSYDYFHYILIFFVFLTDDETKSSHHHLLFLPWWYQAWIFFQSI